LGRTLENLGKDIRTVASGVAGVGDSAEVYALIIVTARKSQFFINNLQLTIYH
jgi:hypothetical protein